MKTNKKNFRGIEFHGSQRLGAQRCCQCLQQPDAQREVAVDFGYSEVILMLTLQGGPRIHHKWGEMGPL